MHANNFLLGAVEGISRKERGGFEGAFRDASPYRGNARGGAPGGRCFSSRRSSYNVGLSVMRVFARERVELTPCSFPPSVYGRGYVLLDLVADVVLAGSGRDAVRQPTNLVVRRGLGLRTMHENGRDAF